MVEVDERVGAQGEVIVPLDEARLAEDLALAHAEGLRAVAIVFMHAYRDPRHEARAAALARAAGFTQVSASHAVSPLMKIVSRADTTVVDAYLSPILRRYVDQVADELDRGGAAVPLYFMKSDGGLTGAARFAGKDAILSGPAGGIVGMVRTSLAAGYDKIIGFDMGRHVDRRVSLRRRQPGRLRARTRDAGRGRAHASADDGDPHDRRWRRFDRAVRRAALARRSGVSGRQSGTCVLPPRRSADGH